MRSRRRSWLAAVVLAAVTGLTSCSAAPVVTRSGTGASSVPATTAPSRAPDSSGLAGAKRAAGIADCPASDPDLAGVPGGLPDAVLPCLGGGRPVRLAGLRGRPMVVNVWASWCAPCRQEAPFLAELAGARRGDLLVLGIDHADGDPGAAIEFARTAGWTYPQIQDRDLVLRSRLQVAALPQTLFVRADGTIAYRNLRPFTSAGQLRDLTERHLGVTW